MNRVLAIIIALLGCIESYSQDVIYLENPSFEGIPHEGGNMQYMSLNDVSPFSAIRKWTDCGFKLETPPDLHGDSTNFFDVLRSPYDGDCFLGMVVRFNDTWERVSQKLSEPLIAGKCYSFSIHLARDMNYKSATKKSEDIKQSFSKPCVLRIYAGNGYCANKELLGETVGVENNEWMRYDFILKPKRDWLYFELQVFYKTPTLFPYNGNLLLDAASPIREIPCPEDIIVAAIPTTPEKFVVDMDVDINQDPRNSISQEKSSIKTDKETISTQPYDAEVVQDLKKEKILKELDAKKIKEGQVIQIEKLYFKADQTKITSNSYEVLDEVYAFLQENTQVSVEIGGHTNSKPKHSYCDSLSTKRAESVAEYLIDKGIPEERIQSKGYGKREPITKGNIPHSHRKNQRVEIKILSIEGAE